MPEKTDFVNQNLSFYGTYSMKNIFIPITNIFLFTFNILYKIILHIQYVALTFVLNLYPDMSSNI